MELTLEKLFESKAKVQILRIFLRNSSSYFTLEDILKLTGLKKREAEKEIKKLKKIGVINQKFISIVISEVRGRNKVKRIQMKSRRVPAFQANPLYDFFHELRNLILRQIPASRDSLLNKVKKLGKVKLAIAAGAFINNDHSRVDLLIVGDQIKRKRLEKMLHKWEANTGRELTYALMTTEEFKYRIDMFDRFTRDILDSPHDKLLNTLNIS